MAAFDAYIVVSGFQEEDSDVLRKDGGTLTQFQPMIQLSFKYLGDKGYYQWHLTSTYHIAEASAPYPIHLSKKNLYTKHFQTISSVGKTPRRVFSQIRQASPLSFYVKLGICICLYFSTQMKIPNRKILQRSKTNKITEI